MVDLIGYIAGLCLSLCFLPQVIHTLMTRRVNDVSSWMLILSFLSALFYEIYASMLQLTPVIIMNGIFLFLVSFEIILKITYKDNQ